MRRITATEDDREVQLIFDDDAFVGYKIGRSLYTGLKTLPAWARPRAAELVRSERARLAALDYMGEDVHQAVALVAGGRGRPRQATCSRGHSLRSARVGADGRRHCRRCEALVRTNARKTAGQTARFESEIERVG
jgi:hypothetical protein